MPLPPHHHLFTATAAAGSLLRSLSGAAHSRRSLSAMAVAAPAAAAATSAHAFAAEAHGFKLETHKFVREYDSHVLLYRHAKVGGGWLVGREVTYDASRVMLACPSRTTAPP
jgi:hypothetical protein